MNVAVRKVAGAIMLFSLFACSTSIAYAEHALYRSKSGDAEAEPSLATIRERIETTFARTGKLCGSSVVQFEHPLYGNGGTNDEYLPAETKTELAAERERNVGLHCLGIGPRDLVPGQNAYWYASDGTHFSVRTFRAELFDPQGVIPQWELRGEIADGQLVVDPSIHRIPAGGPTFPGHPQPRGYF